MVKITHVPIECTNKTHNTVGRKMLDGFSLHDAVPTTEILMEVLNNGVCNTVRLRKIIFHHTPALHLIRFCSYITVNVHCLLVEIPG